jgi:hypothetical protein
VWPPADQVGARIIAADHVTSFDGMIFGFPGT